MQDEYGLKDGKHQDILAAIPCYNMGASIGDVVSKAKKHVSQVVVIDDGSHDDTVIIAKQSGALVISHDVNRGYGKAIKTCFNFAKERDAAVLVILDGDGQHNPDEIPKFVSQIITGKADLVVGSRLIGQKYYIPNYRRLGISVITFLWNFGSKIKVTDAQSGFRAYSSNLIKCLSLSENGMSVSIEILEKARLKKAIIKEVPILCYYSHSGMGLRAIKHGIGVATSVIWLRLKCSLSRN